MHLWYEWYEDNASVWGVSQSERSQLQSEMTSCKGLRKRLRDAIYGQYCEAEPLRLLAEWDLFYIRLKL